MPNFLSSPSTVNAPNTYMLRKPRLAKVGTPKPMMKFAQPSGVPHSQPVQPPSIKMVSVGALAPQRLPRLPKLPSL
jgi:hypothetical protein